MVIRISSACFYVKVSNFVQPISKIFKLLKLVSKWPCKHCKFHK